MEVSVGDWELSVSSQVDGWLRVFFAVIPSHPTFPEFRKRGSQPYELRWDAFYKDAETVLDVS